ncbi:SPFH domain-containing protein [Chitinibacter sp. SCUT-21]|uniref:SPFH domain-containing protein n=1 Tax=Chitinibacter sp. SCUT-21 TaxID=2970891 RepID=UPI0035A62054
MNGLRDIRIVGGVAALVGLGFAVNAFVASVAANHVGVEFNRIDGKVEPVPLSSGWHIIGIGTSVVEFPTFTQTYTWTQSKSEGSPTDESMNFQVASGVVINADISISYSIDSSKAPVLYQKYKRGYEEITSQIIRNAIRNALNSYGTAYDAEGLLAGGKIRLAEQVRGKINQEMNQYGIVVEQFGFVNEMRLPPNIQSAINAKIQATQEALQSEALLRKNQADAANAVAVAKGKAEAKIAEAEGDAKALEVVGEAIKKYGAEAAQVKNQTLWIEKWNGQLPTTSLGNNTTAMVGVK